jgi:hypothetical protein
VITSLDLDYGTNSLRVMKVLMINPAATPVSQALPDTHFLREHTARACYGQ